MEIREAWGRVRRLVVWAVAVGCCWVVSAVPAGASVGVVPASTWQVNGRVEAIATVAGVTYIGGSFTRLSDRSGDSLKVTNLAALDPSGAAITTFHPNVNGEVRAIVANLTTVVVGGSFTTIDGYATPQVAVLSRQGVVNPLAIGTNGEVSALALSAGRLYVGGTFTLANNQPRLNVAAFNVSTGHISRWRADANDRVNALLAQPKRILLGGYFTTVNGAPARHMAAVGPVLGSSQSWRGHPSGEVLTLSQQPAASARSDVFVGVAGRGGAINDFMADGNRRWVRQVDGNVKSLTVIGGQVYVGGHFSNACSKPGLSCSVLVRRQHLLSLSKTNGALTAWNPTSDSALGVYALNRATGWLSIGGDFTKIGKTNQAHYARLPTLP